MGRMGRRQEPAEELEETLEDLPEAEEQEPADLPMTPFARPSSSASRRNAPQSLAELAKVVEFNMGQQTRRIAELAEAHEKKSTILDGLRASLEALGEILEEHTASLEESLDRLETVVAAHIKLIQSQTGRHELGENQPRSQNQSTSSTDDSERKG